MRLRSMPHIPAVLAFLACSSGLLPDVMAGEGRIDATNGDVHFNVHFRFPPTPQQVTDVKAAVDLMSLGVCDATDGQMRVKRVTLSQGEPNEDKGDFWLHRMPTSFGYVHPLWKCTAVYAAAAHVGNQGPSASALNAP